MKNLQQFLIENNFREDTKHNAIYGTYQSFPVIVVYDASHSQYLVTVNAREEEGSDHEKHREAFAALKEEIATVNYINYNEGIVSINLAHDKEMDSENLNIVLKKVAAYAQYEGFRHTCKYCTNETGLDFYSIQGNVECICSECYQKITAATDEKAAKPENYPMGLLGAVLGALIGVVVWIVAYQFGFIVAIAGYLMVACAIKGYQMFSGNLSKKGLWSAVLISVLMLFLAEYLCFAIEVFKIYDVTITECMQFVSLLLSDSEGIMFFMKDIALGLIFMAVASFRYVKTIHQHVSQTFDIKRLD